MMFLAAALILAGHLQAAEGAPYLKGPEGARSSALAGAYGAVEGDVESLWYNPAGIGRLNGFETSVTHLFWDSGVHGVEGLNRDFLSLGLPFGNGALGLLLNYQASSDTYRDSTGLTGGSFGISDMVAGLGYAAHWGDLSLGGIAKVLSERVESQTGSGVVGDLGAIQGLWQNHLTIGLALQNVGQTPILGDTSDPLVAPVCIRGSVGLNDVMPGLVLLGDTRQFMASQERIYALGGEYTFGQRQLEKGAGLALRAGYEIDPSAFGAWSFGAGYHYGQLTLDYSWKPYEVLGTAHKISIGFLKFNSPALDKEPPIEAEMPSEKRPPTAAGMNLATSPTEEVVPVSANGAGKWIKFGNKLLQDGRREDASVAFEKALELEPENVEAQVGLRECKGPN